MLTKAVLAQLPRARQVELVKLLKEAAVKAKEAAVREYVPNPGQLRFHTDLRSNRLLLGGNRSGKTEAGAWETAALCLGEHRWLSERMPPPLNIWVAGVESKVVRRILHRKLLKYIPDTRIENWKPWEGAGILTCSNGSVVTFKSYEEGREKFQSEDLDFIWFDEEPPPDIFEESSVRLVDRMGSWIITMTPLRGMTWVYHDLYCRRDDTPDLGVFQISTADNVDNLGEEAVKKFERRMAGSEEREARLFGGFTALKGLFYPNLSEKLHVVEGADLLVQPDWFTVCSLDPGGTDYTACLLVSRDFAGKWYVRREYLRRHGTIATHAEAIIKMTKDVKVDLWTGDPRAKQWFEEYARYGLNFWPCQAHEVAPLVERIRMLFDPDEEGKPRLVIDSTCKETIRQLREYRRHKNRWGDYEDRAEVRQDDDACDSLRYALFEDIMGHEKKIVRDLPWWIARLKTGKASDDHLGNEW